MKKGDSLRVFIENVQVGRGEITAVRDGEIEVTVPGFVSVIATRTSLSDAPTSLEENNSNREVQVSGIEVVPKEEIVDGTITASPEPQNAPGAPETNSSVQPPSENKTDVTEASTAAE